MTAPANDFAPEIDRHWPGIFRLCLRMLGRRQDAEDAAQQCFYRAFQAWPAFQRRSSVKTWLYRIALNTCGEILRGRRELSRAVPEVPQCDTDHLEESEKAQAVQLAFRSLKPGQQLILTLFCLEGLSQNDVAEILDCPLGTVWSRLHNARKALEAALRAHDPALWE